MDTLTTLEKVLMVERCLPRSIAIRLSEVIFEIKSPHLELLVNALYSTFCKSHEDTMAGLFLFNREELPFVEETLDLVDGFIKVWFSPKRVYFVLSPIKE